MSKEIGIKTRHGYVFIPGINPNSYFDLLGDISDEENTLQELTSRLKALAIASPGDVTPKGCSPLDYITEKVDEVLEELEESYWRLVKLNIAKDFLDDWRVGILQPVESKPNHFAHDNSGVDPTKQEIFDVLTFIEEDDEYHKEQLRNISIKAAELKKEREQERAKLIGYEDS